MVRLLFKEVAPLVDWKDHTIFIQKLLTRIIAVADTLSYTEITFFVACIIIALLRAGMGNEVYANLGLITQHKDNIDLIDLSNIANMFT